MTIPGLPRVGPVGLGRRRGFESVLQSAARALRRSRRRAHHRGPRGGGVPTVPNGLSLRKLHHAAFDRHFLGIRPDHRILIRPDLLGEKDEALDDLDCSTTLDADDMDLPSELEEVEA
ncbi:MAG: HNH endonuclease [Gemmatimonadota bacterium]